jgi:hypothetical protein
MHLCNPADHYPCNAWCHGDIHVDVEYCDMVCLANFGLEPISEFLMTHALLHKGAYKTPPCTIVAMEPALEAGPAEERYAVPMFWNERETRAYRVIYQVHPETPHEETPHD